MKHNHQNKVNKICAKIKSLLNDNEYEKATEYLNEMCENIDTISDDIDYILENTLWIQTDEITDELDDDVFEKYDEWPQYIKGNIFITQSKIEVIFKVYTLEELYKIEEKEDN